MKIQLLFLASLIFVDLNPAIVGSNTAVAVEGLVTFPEADNGTNEMRGFSTFINGFELETFDTTCTFSSFLPVASRVILNGGILYLQRDLTIGTTARIETVGGIYGNDYKLDLTSSITKVDFEVSRTFTLDNLAMFLGDDLSLDIPTRIQGDVVINGRGNDIELLSSGNIIVASGGSLTLENTRLTGLQDINFRCEANDASITLKNAELVLSHDMTFPLGSLSFEQDVILSGTNTFVYSSVVGSTIQSQSQLYIDFDATFSYEPAIAFNNLLLMVDDTSVLHLDGCSVHVSSTGLQLTKGTVRIGGRTRISSDATVESEAITFGDGSDAANDITFEIEPQATLELQSGFLINKNVG